ncbi:hypothetical protein EDC04DRAFT_2891161 [Pisolithus marmoratus]|nr:hypothetical protein EDC04DRAFT_2891161 [Pisolithus marmoratus]
MSMHVTRTFAKDQPHLHYEEDGISNQATDHDIIDAGDEDHFMGAGNDHNEQVDQGSDHPHADPPPPPPPDNDHPSWPPNCLLNLDLDELANMAKMPKLQHSMTFIQEIRNASLNDGIGLTGEALEHL